MRANWKVGAAAFLFTAGIAQAQSNGIIIGTSTTVQNPNGSTTTTNTSTGPAATNAEAQAESARIAAATAAVPGSGIAPATTLSGTSGTEEGSLLLVPAARMAADHIIKQVGGVIDPTKPTGAAHKVLVFLGATPTAPDLSAWLYFQSQTKRLQNDLDNDTKSLHDCVHPTQNSCSSQPNPAVTITDRMSAKDFFKTYGNAPRIQMALVNGTGSVAIAIIPKLFSYATTSYQTSGVGLTIDDYMMDVALMEEDPSWSLYSQRINATLPDDIATPLETLDTDSLSASKEILEAQPILANLSAKKNPSPGTAARIKQITAGMTTLTADLAGYQSFVSTLNSSTSMNWSSVVQAYAIHRALQTLGGVVFVKVHSASIGVLTKTNLWTNLGAMPMYTSAGLVVSYVYYRPDSNLDSSAEDLTPAKAGLFEVMTKYNKAGTLDLALSEDKNGDCLNWNTTPKDDRKAAEYCPTLYSEPPVPTPPTP
jgi:hypothetical protein